MSEIKFNTIGERRVFTDSDSKSVVMSFFIQAIFWLLYGSILAIIASFKMHLPDYLGDIEWLSFGRVRPVHLNTMVYGWASLASAGVALWILTRTLRTTIPFKGMLYLGQVIWNIGLIVGTFT